MAQHSRAFTLGAIRVVEYRGPVLIAKVCFVEPGWCAVRVVLWLACASCVVLVSRALIHDAVRVVLRRARVFPVDVSSQAGKRIALLAGWVL